MCVCVEASHALKSRRSGVLVAMEAEMAGTRSPVLSHTVGKVHDQSYRLWKPARSPLRSKPAEPRNHAQIL